MKHLKILGLLVMAAASLMAFAASASANPVLTSNPGVHFTGTIHATLEKETSDLLKGGITTTCTESTIHFHITTNNTTHAIGPITSWTFSKCGSSDVVTVTGGSLTITDIGETFLIGSRVEIKETSLGVTCFYGGAASPGTKIGKLEGTKLPVNASLKKQEGSNFFCAAEATWTAIYRITTPAGGFLIT